MPALRRSRRAVVALPFLGLILSAVAVVAIAQSMMVSSSRRLLVALAADEIAVLAARSAFEEAAATLETSFPPIPFPGPGDMENPRNLRWLLPFPAAVAASRTAEAFAAQKVVLGPVQVESTDWQVAALDIDRKRKRALVTEGGMLTLSVVVTVPSHPRPVRRVFSTRRLMGCVPDVTGERARVVVEAGDVGFGFRS